VQIHIHSIVKSACIALAYSLLLLLLFIKRPITIICILESVGIVLRFITVKDDDLLE